MSKKDNSVLEDKKTIFGRRYGLLDFKFLFLVELHTCVQNLMFTKVVKGWQKNIFHRRECWNSHTKAVFWQ
jgi:hypothetical protein